MNEKNVLKQLIRALECQENLLRRKGQIDKFKRVHMTKEEYFNDKANDVENILKLTKALMGDKNDRS